MSERPLFDCTTSGGSLPDSASRSVVFRSSNDLDTRFSLMFGYFAWNSSLSCFIWAAWPPRTSWSQTVRVTLPRAAASVRTDEVGDAFPAGSSEPGAQAARPSAATAARAAARRTVIRRTVRRVLTLSRYFNTVRVQALCT